MLHRTSGVGSAAQMDDDGDIFWVETLRCKAMKGWIVKVGLNLKKAKQFPVKIKVGQDREEAVRGHPKYTAALEAAAAALGDQPGAIPHSNVLEIRWICGRKSRLLPISHT